MAANWWDKLWDPNADQTQLGNRITGLLDNSLNGPAPYFNQSLFTGAGQGTQDAWAAGNSNANGLINSGGLDPTQGRDKTDLNHVRNGYGKLGDNNGLTGGQTTANRNLGGLAGDYGNLGDHNGLTTSQGRNQTNLQGIGQGYADLSGAYDQKAPGYANLRRNLMDDAVKNVGAGFLGSGRFGGGSYVDTATTSAVDAVAPLDYQNFQNGINNRSQSLDRQAGIQNNDQTGVGNQFGALAGRSATDATQFGMGQQGIDNRNAAIGQLGAIGAAQDTNTQGARMGAADLYDRKHNAEINRLQQVGNIFKGVSGATNNQPAWWQQAAGAAASVAPWFAGF